MTIRASRWGRSIAAAMMVVGAAAAQAGELMPSFAGVPSGWVVDRYAPAQFANVGTYMGRADALAIGISTADAYNNRPAAYQSSFYNTQGMQYAVSGGAGSTVSSGLYIDAAWRDGSVGNVRTDMWGVAVDALAAVSAYPIIGFTNYDGAARYRVWDTDGMWVDLATAVNFGGWTDFSIAFTGISFDYFIDDILVYSDTGIDGSVGLSGVIMQAYNFGGDPALVGAVGGDYTVRWASAAAAIDVPEPASLALVGLALAGAAAARRRRQT